ncbi:TPA: TlyA family RNA methyltransferase [Candidatus Poribacteria bacterium]|nr:TlyA family RNA methyltransferase [Candidatus Poribacteria bacterium]HEX29618.1 TlyA family RNA methyltransferase [Candidatus Poribacteria bacterium]
MSEPKKRLDMLLVERGLARSREQAKRLIMAGEVLVDDVPETKPGKRVRSDVRIRIRREIPYVSRGGLKLEGALRDFNLDVTGSVVLDVGASTGGFTDCLLQHGAAFVYALDVGYGQLDWKLRGDKRVKPMDRINIRYASPDMFDKTIDMATVDVSFICLKLVLPVLAKIVRDGGLILALVKPQFEAGREKVQRGGVVRDPKVHAEVLSGLVRECRKWGLRALKLTFSPIKGPAGNIEFFLLFEVSDGGRNVIDEGDIDKTVMKAHRALDNPPRQHEEVTG